MCARDFSSGVEINPGTQKEKEKRFKGRQAKEGALG